MLRQIFATSTARCNGYAGADQREALIRESSHSSLLSPALEYRVLLKHMSNYLEL